MTIFASTKERQQEVFNKAYLGLAAQGFRRSIKNEADEDEMCRYRSPNGLKCAVGHLLTDEQYTPEMEGNSILSLERLTGVDLGEVFGVDMMFLQDLQECHDSGLEPSEMIESLVAFAERFGLTVPVVPA